MPVTKELSDGVIAGQWPKAATEIVKCVTVADHNRWLSEGRDARAQESCFQAHDCIQGSSQKPVGEVPCRLKLILATPNNQILVLF